MFKIPMNQNTNRPYQNTNRPYQNTNGPYQNTNLVGIMIIGILTVGILILTRPTALLEMPLEFSEASDILVHQTV